MKRPNDRSGRINAIKSEINENQKIEKDKLFAKTSIELGVTRKKLEEYLDILKVNEDVKEEDGKLEYIGDE